jgi:hypothetical protein
MTRSVLTERRAHRTAKALRDLFHHLFELSEQQMDTLEREDFENLESLAARKAELLTLIPRAVEEAKQYGWMLHDPSTFPSEGSCAALVREAADLARRLQAHERYVLGQMVVRKNAIGTRLDAILENRNAAAGYRVMNAHGSTIDTAR